MTLYKWSQTAASNATADAGVNWSEGQAPSSVNDSARAMMAATAKYRDDCNGAITATGSASAIAVTTNQGFTSYAAMNRQELTFFCPVTNAAGMTLTADGLGALPVNGVDGVAIPAGVMLAGGVYTVTCVTTEFILHAYTGNPYNTPLGGGMLYFGGSAPNNYFTFANGAAISRTTYASFFALVGTAYGAGDGASTFNLPDLSGRVPAGRENVASRLTGAYFGGNSTVLGAVGGLESATLSVAQLPTGITSSGLNSISVSSTVTDVLRGGTSDNFTSTAGSGQFDSLTKNTITSTNPSQAIAVTSNNTSGAAHNNVQPTFICNFIIRIL
jgi:microcystin-dependent protein